MGLLDNEAANYALAGGLLRGDPGGGFAAYGQTLANQRQQDIQNRLLLTQIAEAEQRAKDAERMRLKQGQLDNAASASFISPETANAMSMGPMPDGSNVPAQPSGFDLKGYTQRLYAIDPMTALKFEQSQAKDTPFNKVDAKDFTPASIAKFSQTRNYADLVPARKLEVVNNQAVDLYNTAPGTVLDSRDPNKPFFSIGGQAQPNSAFQQYEKDKAAAGAARTNVSVNTEKTLLNDIAGGLGKGITDAKAGAQAAVSTIGTVNRLMDALDTNKVMAGPTTSFRQYGLQVGNLLGIGGKDAQEKLLNTRQAIQSLAQLELDAAQQMKGQGQITEAERSIIRRAASGDIDSMTTGELRLLGGVLDRSARSKIRSYNTQVKPLASNPNAAPLVPFLNVDEPGERQQPNVLRFDARGNPVP